MHCESIPELEQCLYLHNVTVIKIKRSVYFTKSVNGVDWSFLQVKVDVFGHSERLALPILSPRNQTKKTRRCKKKIKNNLLLLTRSKKKERQRPACLDKTFFFLKSEVQHWQQKVNLFQRVKDLWVIFFQGSFFLQTALLCCVSFLNHQTLPQLPPVSPGLFRHLLPSQCTQLSFWWVFEPEQTEKKSDMHMYTVPSTVCV